MKAAKLITLKEALQMLKERDIRPVDYKHLNPEQIKRLALEGRV